MRVFVASLAVVFAALFPVSPWFQENCATPQTQTDMTICAVKKYEQTGRAQRCLQGDHETAEGRSRDGQAAHCRGKGLDGIRDAECTFANSATVGGSIHPMPCGAASYRGDHPQTGR